MLSTSYCMVYDNHICSITDILAYMGHNVITVRYQGRIQDFGKGVCLKIIFTMGEGTSPQSTMGKDRLNGLAFMLIHRDVELNPRCCE